MLVFFHWNQIIYKNLFMNACEKSLLIYLYRLTINYCLIEWFKWTMGNRRNRIEWNETHWMATVSNVSNENCIFHNFGSQSFCSIDVISHLFWVVINFVRLSFLFLLLVLSILFPHSIMPLQMYYMPVSAKVPNIKKNK